MVALNGSLVTFQDGKQVVKINNSISDERDVSFGVPQGSVLGPILFNLYLNDFCSLLTSKNTNTICFADDTVISFAGDSWQEVVGKVTNGLKMLKKWYDLNLLSLNESKTNYICFAFTKAGLPREDIVVKIHSCNDTMQICNCKPISENKLELSI